MLGRYAAMLIASTMIVFFPIKYEAVKEAQRSENAAREAVDTALSRIRAENAITMDCLESLMSGLFCSGNLYDVEIMLGTILYGKEEKVLDIRYTEDIMSEIGSGQVIDVRGKIVTIKARLKNTGISTRLANMLWDSFIPSEEMTSGGYIYG